MSVAERIAAPIVAAAVLGNKASVANVRRDLAELPGLLDRLDRLLEEGTIGGAELNAADFQSGPAPPCWPAWTTCGRSWRRDPP